MIKDFFKENLISYFRKIFGLKNTKLLVEDNSKNAETSKQRNKIKPLENDISEKKIIMYLYKQIRLGKIDLKYIPNEYLLKIKKLLEEEKAIKENKIKQLNKQIQEKEYLIKKNI